MGAQNILLTHFSQRYPKIPSLQSATPPLAVDSLPLTSVPATLGDDATESQSNAGISAGASSDPPVAIAFDCVSIPIGSLWKMSRYTPALERVFAELEDAGAEDEETVLRASAMGIPVESLGPVGSSSSGSPSKTGRKSQARAGGPSPVTKAAKKQKISANKSKAVG